VSSAIQLGIQIVLIALGPILTARILATLMIVIDGIKDPMLRAEIDNAYNVMKSKNDLFKKDRDDHQQQ